MTGNELREMVGARLHRVVWSMVSTIDLILSEMGSYSEKEEHGLTHILIESVWLTKDL